MPDSANISSATSIDVGLNAAIVTVMALQPMILVVSGEADVDHDRSMEPDSLPFGLFDPLRHRTMEMGLRDWVKAQTNLQIGYAEQLYTFGDRGRHARKGDVGPHVMSVGYLALTRPRSRDGIDHTMPGVHWRPWYTFFPWEDWRKGEPNILRQTILPLLEEWCALAPNPNAPKRSATKAERVRLAFGQDDTKWDEERVLDRYELLYEAGLVEEARRDGRSSAGHWTMFPELGRVMLHDHRRILATAISRFRAKLKYRPVVFELMPEAFTLTELQHVVEAISGRHLHKQNFRRLVEQSKLVEATGELSSATGGRPAALFRYRRDVMQEHSASGLRLGGRS